MQEANFSFYGINLTAQSDDAQIINDLKRDFSFFATQEKQTTGLNLVIYREKPPYASLPAMQARYTSPRNICYCLNGVKYIDYPGQALIKYERKSAKNTIYSEDYRLLHQISYMSVLSLIAEGLDAKGLHRIHGLGLSIEEKAVLILLDTGGGKTNLALSVLTNNNNYRLLSEDSPLIDRSGNILPFPIRIGVRPKDLPAGIPEKYLRDFPRDEAKPKILIDTEFFRGRLSNKANQPHLILLGRRTLGQKSQIRPASKYSAFKELIKNCVVGVGLFQGVEYVFENSSREVILKIPLAFSRLKNSWKLIKRSKIFEFFLSMDKQENFDTFSDFVNRIQNK